MARSRGGHAQRAGGAGATGGRDDSGVRRRRGGDPEGVLGRDGLLPAPYRKDVTVPGGAHDTGFRHRVVHLWATDDQDTAHVRTSGTVEARPRAKRGAGCD
ncbi:hypothetical protein AB0E10_21375 [Streptomyces sp. NPDC048045]|uniref:hypothetical protein n=1 Tax=Streptomyces sp. NPDC048045 TaxID=3154710 RepID=UPI003420C294